LWLLDPFNVTIQNTAGNLDGDTPNFQPSADDSTVRNTVINTALDNNMNVLVTTARANTMSANQGNQPGNITQNADAPIAKTAGATDVTLTLRAANDIVLDGTITASGGAGVGKLNLSLIANDSTQSSHDPMTAAGNVAINNSVGILSGSFSSSGVGFSTGAGGTISAGDVTITHSGAVAVNAPVRAASLALNGSSITLNAAGTTANPTVQTTGGGQTYAAPLTLTAATVLEDTASGAIAFNSTVNGAQALQVNTAGATTFGGAVGGTAPLTSLETDNTGATAGSKGGSVAVNATVRSEAVALNDATATLNAAGTTANPTVQTAGGGQTYAAAVTLSAATVWKTRSTVRLRSTRQ
jgi:hypothetical protein